MARATTSMAKFNAMAHKVSLMQKKTAKIREVADEKVQYAVRIAEVGAAAGAAGVYQGMRLKKGKAEGKAVGPWEIFDIPAELLLGASLHAAGLFGVGGNMSSHLHAFGDGLLSVGLYHIGVGLGEGGLSGLKKGFGVGGVAGALPYSDDLGGQRLTDEELEALAR